MNVGKLEKKQMRLKIQIKELLDELNEITKAQKNLATDLITRGRQFDILSEFFQKRKKLVSRKINVLFSRKRRLSEEITRLKEEKQ